MAISRGPRGAKALLAFLLVGAPLAYLGLAAAPAAALTAITVTSNADSGANTLRAALTTANTTADDVEIDVQTGLGTITLASSQEAYTGGTGGTHSLTVKGNGVTIAAGSLTAFSSTAGAISIDAVTISGTGGDDAIDSTGTGAITVTNSTITGKDDGIYNDVGAVSVTNSTISNNAGDGIHDNGGGAVTVTDSQVSGNGGDGIYSGSGSVTVTGSRLSGNSVNGIDTGSGNSIVVTDSTIDANHTNGIDTGSGVSVTANNSTFTGNHNDAIDLGSGITLNLAYDTIDQNNATSGGGGQIDAGGGTVTSFGTVITRPGTGATDCSTDATMTSQGYNYVDDATCQFTMATDKSSSFNPQLGSLGSNGGSTPTELPQTGSVLIDGIPTSSCQTGLASGITSDQRGITRPQGPGCDVGAVEVAVATSSTTTPTTAPTPIPGASTPHTGEPWAGSRPIVLGTIWLSLGLIVIGAARRRGVNRARPTAR